MGKDLIPAGAARFVNGEVILVNKPLGWTSFDAVKKIRYLLKQKFGLPKLKVGHAGTLDPLADGLLIICTGKKTKEIHTFQNQPKEYTGIFCLGATTPSYDLETAVQENYPIKHITETNIHQTAAGFVGIQEQTPPLFSAKMIDGKRAYLHARRGEEKELKAVSIEIYAFEITKIALPDVHFKVVCSKGTYIRSLANDFGKALQSGAYLKKLSRTAIGEYTLEAALSPEDFKEKLNEE